MTYILYKLTRDDGKLYIGTTYKDGFKRRMLSHSKSTRFKGYAFSVDIVLECDDYDTVMCKETEYITIYDTFYNGLNESIDGKGNHLCNTFTTKGYKFSEQSRIKMSESAKKRTERDGVNFKGKCHTDDTKKRLSDIRKGKIWKPTKMTSGDVDNLLNIYYNDKPVIDGVGQVMKNGRVMSYERAFALKYSEIYNVTPESIYGILKGKGWQDVQRKYKV